MEEKKIKHILKALCDIILLLKCTSLDRRFFLKQAKFIVFATFYDFFIDRLI